MIKITIQRVKKFLCNDILVSVLGYRDSGEAKFFNEFLKNN